MRRVRSLLLVVVAGTTLVGTAGATAATTGSWSLSIAPVGAGVRSSSQGGVSCPSEQFCMQVGHVVSKTGLVAIAYSPTSSESTALPVPIDARRPANASLNAIDCPSQVSCVAVGSYTSYDSRVRALVETYHAGTWRASTIPGLVQRLNGVACNAAHCLATGTYFDNDFDHGFVAVRDSTGTWTAPPIVRPPYGYRTSKPVCPPHGPCTAQVHVESAPAGDELLHPTTNGYAGTPFPAPSGSAPSSLAAGALACPTAKCIGLATFAGSDGRNHLVAERLSPDGRLTSTELPLPAAVTPSTVSIAPTPMSCTHTASGLLCAAAVNVYFGGPEPHATLVQFRSGSWRVRLAPNPAGAQPASVHVTDVSCSSTGHCAAVGSFRSRAGHGRALVEDLTASTPWQPVALPVPDGLSALDDIELSAVSCTGTRCLADGRVYYRPHNTERQQLLVARYG